MEIYEMTSEGTLKGLSKERRLEDNDVSDSTDNGRNSETDSEAKRLPAKRLSTPEANIEVDAINDDKETDAKYVPLTDEPKTDSSPRGSDSSRKQYSSASKKAEMNVKVLNTTAAGANAHSKEAESKTVLLNGKTIRLIPINFKNVLNNQSQTIAVGEENTVDAASRSVAESSNIVKSPVSSSTNSFQIVELRQDVAAKSDSLDEKMEKDDKISEFIFKGEEYLQMPKQHFYDKINKLKRSVAYYEGVIKNMRSILDTADPTSSLDC
uniref:Uncharacterized protein n=1 Tax=Anopheles christyi TaxID=43041 RepID=A0A182JWE2_9DIPT